MRFSILFRDALRFLALVILAAVFYVHAPPQHDRLIVFAIPGARWPALSALTERGELPLFKVLLETSVNGHIRAGALSAKPLWERLLPGLRQDPGAEALLPQPRRFPPVWGELGGRHAVVAAVPGAGDPPFPGVQRWAGADPASGFLGGNMGLVLTLEEPSGELLPWPYSVGRRALASTGRVLDIGQCSEWVQNYDVSVKRTYDESPSSMEELVSQGVFKLCRMSPETMYLTPVYLRRRVIGGSERGHFYVAEEPATYAAGVDLAPILYEHIRDLSGMRFEVVRSLVQGWKPESWGMAVYYETLLSAAVVLDGAGDTREGGGLDSEPFSGVRELAAASFERDAYREIERRLGRILTGRGGASTVVILGAPAPGDLSGGDFEGFYAVSNFRGAASTLDLSPEALAAGLYYVAGAAMPGALPPVPDLLRWRFRSSAGYQFSTGQNTAEPAVERLDPAKLETLGATRYRAGIYDPPLPALPESRGASASGG